MFDELAGDFDLNGEWLGYYEHDRRISDQKFPISATLFLDFNRIEGKMTDGVTDIDWLYQTIVESLDDRMGQTARDSARAVMNRFPDTKIEHALPQESSLRGKRAGDRIRFTKSYLGRYTVSINTGQQIVPVIADDHHRVEYSGTLNAGKAMIQGQWTIWQKGLFGRFKPPTRGTFALFKKK